MKLEWDKSGERLYETGVDQCALFAKADGVYTAGVAWNGITNVTKSPSGGEASPVYANNKKYLNLMSNEELGGTIQAYTYPDNFKPCLGIKTLANGVEAGQQKHEEFGIVFKTKIGNDQDGTEHGYKIHIIYNCLASTSESAYATINESPEAMSMSWSFTTTPVEAEGLDKPTSSLVINSTTTNAGKLKALEDLIYGTNEEEPKLPKIEEVVKLIGQD